MNESNTDRNLEYHRAKHYDDPPGLESWIDDHFEEFCFDYTTSKHPELWELFNSQVVAGTGRLYQVIDEAPIGLLDSYYRWFQSDTLRMKLFDEWVLANLPEGEPPDEEENQ